jgi:DNA-binding transcriptional MerR regulator
MRIGELAQRTNTSSRLLRYYEQRGLITSGRAGNGYREYDEDAVDRVGKIRGLLGAGLPTRIIKDILPCLDHPDTIYCPTVTPDLIAQLAAEQQRLTERIEQLTRNRGAIAEYLAGAPAVERAREGQLSR